MLRSTTLSMLCAIACVACASADGSSEDQDEGALGEDAPALYPEPSGAPAKHPFVLAHGFNASTTNGWSFYRVADALARDHAVVVLAEVPPFASADERAKWLAKDVDRALEKCRTTSGCDASGVNLIAHSMGGLDARALVGKLGYGDRVKSITTIASPHRGTAIADTLLKLVPPATDDAVDAFASFFGRTFTRDELARDASVRGALESLAESNAETFAREHPDDARVYFQSYAGVSSVLGRVRDADLKACEGQLPTYKSRSDRMDVRLVPMAAFVAHGAKLDPNDGMATVESAKWGAFRGCVPADHYGEIGQPKRDGANAWTGFDHVRFYRTVAFDLAKRGF